jgi:hypothetical protein
VYGLVAEVRSQANLGAMLEDTNNTESRENVSELLPPGSHPLAASHSHTSQLLGTSNPTRLRFVALCY